MGAYLSVKNERGGTYSYRTLQQDTRDEWRYQKTNMHDCSMIRDDQ